MKQIEPLSFRRGGWGEVERAETTMIETRAN